MSGRAYNHDSTRHHNFLRVRHEITSFKRNDFSFTANSFLLKHKQMRMENTHKKDWKQRDLVT